mmetsp:Transcript_51763/g.138550  ORF Transcript_51763/g.138550 Transcript_51763/m.138550 type:complete len:249 (-) Transcript_51763:66-812(-)|eukprot:CAMPEP_0171170300 /NCGR_PEP_ID=MMETSP0790-20130122/8644_1 /TAXON_ID=2925 /ORGANISM="Alexandrium catenella, Strain OF101" /LENGTH=248 /DNA_ID=CAMNT_0011635145 /DNA_START=85 /DNA_END=831 /DNA_ORIENTATION=-
MPSARSVALAVLALAAGPQSEAAATTIFENVVRSMPAGSDATAEAIQALDTDGSGKVEREEIAAFARSQGLSADDVREEFKSLDTNGDGELEASEISRTLADEKKPEPKAAAPAPVLEQNRASKALKLDAVELDAQHHAGKALAEVFARTAAKALESRNQDSLKATALEEAAKNLRGRTAEIRRTAAAQTAQAAKDAAAAVLREAAGQVKQLEEQATQAEKKAVQKRAEAKAAMERALAAQAAMAASV